MKVLGNDFFEKNWRQGSLLPIELIQLINNSYNSLKFEVNNKDLLIVVSHDCDLNHPKLKVEPYCELVIARPSKEDPNKRYGKSQRYFQFEHSNEGWYEVCSTERFSVPRELLIQHGPKCQLNEEDRKRLVFWIAHRYGRSAFPDAFNKRLSRKKSEIETCLSIKGKFITDIYLRVEDLELENGKVYKISGRAIMKDGEFLIDDKKLMSSDAVDEITQIFKDVEIEFIEPLMLVSDEEISWASIRELKHWNMDVISFDLDDYERINEEPRL